MFPLTHVLVAQDLLLSSHPRVVLGSIFPDLGNVVGLNRTITHEMGTGFFGFCRNDCPGLLDFARAVITHGSEPFGLDYFADENFQGYDQGYCFQRGSVLVKKVVQSCNLPPEMGYWKAHNFIEMAYELVTVERYPGVVDLVMETLHDLKIISQCSDALGQYFNMDISKIGITIARMPDFFCLSRVTPLNLAKKYALQLKIRHNITGSDLSAMAKVISEAREMIEGEYRTFLDDVLKEILEVLKHYPVKSN